MPYCKKCGEEASKGAKYCSKCGFLFEYGYEIVLATWGERFIAFLIDMILMGVLLSWFSLPGLYWMPHMWRSTVPRWVPFADIGSRNILYFLYWAFLEGVYGQSIGKMAMKIKVAHVDGGPVDMGRAAIQSVGKAFLLPLDLILGWILYPSKQQRLFNRVSDTVVLKKDG